MRHACRQQHHRDAAPQSLVDAAHIHLAEKAESRGLQDGEDETWHVAPSGWFSSEVLGYAMRNTQQLFGALLESLVLNPHVLEDADVSGALQRRPGHWVAIR